MKILAVDTSSRFGVLGLCDGETLLAEMSLQSKEAYSARLLPSIDWLLAAAGLSLDDIEGFGVVVGPGSFTGLRVGLATIKGFAYARNVPVVGLTSLEVLAAGLGPRDETVVPLLDARRGTVFSAAYRVTEEGPQEIRAPWEAEVPEVNDFLSALGGNVVVVGDGARALRPAGVRFAAIEMDAPRGGVAARLARRALNEGRHLAIETAEPLYLRLSEAERKRKEPGT